MKAATALVERRYWLPAYRTTLIDKEGKVLESRYFWRSKTAMNWGFTWNLEREDGYVEQS